MRCVQRTLTSEQELNIVIKYLPEHIKLTRQERGCVSFEVKQSQNPLIWDVHEVFESRQSFENHQRRISGSVWGIKTQHIQRLYEITLD
ncbi:putative quinol monooxygenase [Acinetobacter guillouiae]|uniref:putative quinol monooxygenase n=1 Tax=Acinetobacter guillouiae TaxID=106649 RepID=UPI003014269E